MHVLSIAAMVAVTSVPVSRVPAPIAASRPVAIAQTQTQNLNFYRPVYPRQMEEASTCRMRAFFNSNIAKPLEAVYFSRPGALCSGVPFYGFVFVTR